MRHIATATGSMDTWKKYYVSNIFKQTTAKNVSVKLSMATVFALAECRARPGMREPGVSHSDACAHLYRLLKRVETIKSALLKSNQPACSWWCSGRMAIAADSCRGRRCLRTTLLRTLAGESGLHIGTKC